MFFRGRQPEASIWRRFRTSADGFTFTQEEDLWVAHVVANAERVVDLFYILSENMPPAVDVHIDDLRSGRSWKGENVALPDVREAIARLKSLLGRYGGLEISIYTADDQLTLNPYLELFVYARDDRWLYLARGQGTRRAAAGADEELEDQPATLPGGAGAGLRGGRRGRATRTAGDVTGAELLYAIAAAAANLLGALAVTLRVRWSLRALDAILSLAAGFLISVSLVDLLPGAIARAGTRGAIVALVAYVLVHLTQHTIGGHFHFGEETHEVTSVVSMTALVGLLMHTFVDGVAMSSGVRVSQGLGAIVFVAVLLHKFPEGLAISSLFLAAGASRTRAIGAALALGLMTIAGVLLTDLIGPLRDYGLAISAGVTLYVGASNLVPEFQDKKGMRIPASFVSGCILYFIARSLAIG